MNILEKIIQLREKRGWSMYRLAKEANIPESTLSNCMRRGNTPSLATLMKICNALDITLSQLFAEGALTELTNKQQTVLDRWCCLSEVQKEKVDIYMSGMLEK